MAISVNIPGLLRLTIVKTPAEAAGANDAVGVDRLLSGRGGLVNRLIIGKIAPFRTSSGRSWPAFAGRMDPIRAGRQAELEQKLTATRDLFQHLAPEINDLAAFVCGRKVSRPVGVIVQQLTGRLFFLDFEANEASYKAAVTVSGWLSAGPLKTLYLRWTGQFDAALQLMTELARGNVACAHATSIAFHNMVKSVKLMRKLARSHGNLKNLSPPDAAAKVLRGPPRVIREARDAVVTSTIRLKERSLVLIPVESVRKETANPKAAFFSEQWNRCPASDFVPALFAEVWRTAQASRRDST